ncbi:MAG: hypothetical protein J1E60_02455 [Christensenellaceae bacterium]|nr:hypothetical protein [Christensenellaceae bacterium]
MIDMLCFLKTQLYGIAKSKRLICTLLFAPALLLFCSYNAEAAIFPVQYVLVLFAGLISMLSSEILHWLTIDEIKDGIFDVLLISPQSRLQLLMNKLFVPVVIGAGLAFLSLVTNNILAKYFRFAVWNFTFTTSLLLIFGAIFFGLLEFITLLVMRKNNMNIHFFLLAFGVCVMLGLFYLIQIKALLLLVLISLFLLIFSLAAALILLKRKHQVIFSKRRYTFARLYGDNKLSISGALIRKNISVLRLYKYSWLQIVIAVSIPVLIGSIEFFSAYSQLKPIMIIAFAAAPSVVNIYLIFYSSLYENRSRVADVLRINGVGIIRRITEKALSAWIVSCVLCAICFIATSLFCALSPITLLGTLGANLVSALICSMCSCRISSFKGEYIYKTLISIMVVALQFIVFKIM